MGSTQSPVTVTSSAAGRGNRRQRLPGCQATGDADADAPCGDLAVLLLADEVQLGGAYVGVPGELPHLVHLRPVADGVVDRRLAQRVHADAAPPRGKPTS